MIHSSKQARWGESSKKTMGTTRQSLEGQLTKKKQDRATSLESRRQKGASVSVVWRARERCNALTLTFEICEESFQFNPYIT